MSFFSFVRDERLVFAGLGVAAVSVVGMMHLILEYYRDETEIKPQQPKTQYITQETEDALKIDTLNSLITHYNFSIRDTAVKIAAGRAVNDPAIVDQLLWGITREDYEERMKSVRAITFAVEEKDVLLDPLSILDTPKAYSALVRCLELGLDLPGRSQDKLDDPLYDEYYLRDIGERRCILLLHDLLHKHGVEKLVKAKFIEKWLVRQNWGETEEERMSNFANYMKFRKNRIADICHRLKLARIGRRALRDAKLIGRDSAGRLRPQDRASGNRIKVILEISMSNEDENGEIQQENFQTEFMPRVLEQSAEEQRRRRRHREAIVLNDGTHSLERSDIIQREHGEHDGLP
ncbi:hypothetical protein PG984_001034 [Apiospora sp. TS-2023a]